jgi:hypothetical protein
MFWRSDCCYRCSRRRARRSFARGIAAALTLVLACAVLLHGHDHAAPARSRPGHTASGQPHHGHHAHHRLRADLATPHHHHEHQVRTR